MKFLFYYDSYLTGKVIAGTATLEVKTEPVQIDERQTYHIIGTGRTKGAFNLFFKVDDRFETYIDEEFLVPWRFVRYTREGGYKYDDEVKFNQFSGTALSTRANKTIPKGTHDVLSAFFFARNLDLSNAKTGDTFPLWFYLDDSLYVSRIQFVGTEEVEIELGTFRCLRFKPMVATGNVFSQPYPMDLWVTDDKNKLPILAKSAVVVGAVKMELIKYSGLANPVTAKIKD